MTKPLTAEALKAAARESVARLIQTGTDPQGRIYVDPLRELIPGETNADTGTLAVVRNITGKVIAKGTGPDTYQNTAPAARAILRRWAMRADETPDHYAPVSAALAALAQMENA